MLFSKMLLSFVLVFQYSLIYANVDDYFESIKEQPGQLYSFFKKMPKGGELHYHLAGGAYPEAMIKLAASDGYSLEKNTYTAIQNPKENNNALLFKQVVNSPKLYKQTLQAWSMLDFIPGKESGHDHFFNSFYKFMPLVAQKRAELLAEIMERAANQHELYMELMVLPDNAQSSSFGSLIKQAKTFEDKKNILLKNKPFQNIIRHTRTQTQQILDKARQQLNCDKGSRQAACKLTIKFQYYVLREQPFDNLFAQALNGFAAAEQSDELVAINLVQAEDNPLTLRDFHKHMLVFKYLHQLYPKVHIALHAGELSPETIPPEHLKYHIHDAIFTGHAERIGHGVDILHENQAEEILKYMAQKRLPVEINLSSNHHILGVSGKNHPLSAYLSHQVPIVLSTDDEGVLRTDLTQEYVNAVMNHQIDYTTLRQMNRNTLTYSFLPGKSLWSDAGSSVPVIQCKTFDSASCLKYIKKEQKAKLQWRLEMELNQFEKHFAL